MKQLLASPSLQLVTYPASATAQSAEFASADCVTGLNEIGQISGVYRRYCMRECHLQQMNNAGCGASALSGLQFSHISLS